MEPQSERLLRVPLESIQPNPEQPRVVFDPEALQSLAASIRAHGVMNPLVVRPAPGGGYFLIAGERRWRASGLAGLREVPVIVRAEDPSLTEQLEMALVENLQREDLDPIEAALGYQRLIQLYGLTQEQVAERVGKDRTTVANALRLLKLPEKGQTALRSGKISAGHARALLPLEDATLFERALTEVTTKELSVRATEQLVRGLKRSHSKKREVASRSLDRLGEQLTRQLGRRVHLQGRKDGGGRVTLEWADAEDLERLLAWMDDE